LPLRRRLRVKQANEIVLTINELQQYQRYEKLCVIREVTQRRVWFAEPLMSGATSETRKLFVRAKEIPTVEDCQQY
jgi:hypothetical protein